MLAESAMNSIVNEGSDLDMSSTNQVLRDIRDKDAVSYSGGYKFVNKSDVKSIIIILLVNPFTNKATTVNKAIISIRCVCKYPNILNILKPSKKYKNPVLPNIFFVLSKKFITI